MRGNSKLRYARAVWIIERRLRGDTVADIAKALNLKENMVFKEIARAEERGVVEKVRERLLAALENAPDVYTEVLQADPKTLHELSRGYSLKLKALDSMNAGLGVFKSESVRETKNTLSVIAEEVAAEPSEKVVQGHRVTFEPAPALPPPSEPSILSTILAPADGGVSEGAQAPADLATKASDSEQH